jgi:threonylcarbamoyladenosine tRNA methylthiotransferase MtaB
LANYAAFGSDNQIATFDFVDMSRQRTVAFHTLGCKLNFAETSTIARQLQAEGYTRSEWGSRADLCVINTCSVTEHAERKCRQAINQARRASPHTRIAVVGCYAQLKPQEVASLPGVNLVLGTQQKFGMAHYADVSNQGVQIRVSDIEDMDRFEASYSVGDRTRSFLKIQDGCSYACSYCTIPMARGRSRSDTIESVVERARALGASGIKELVLTGVNTGDFGLSADGQRIAHFVDLLRALDNVQEISRVRISSIEPNLLTGRIIDLIASSSRLMPHLHIPLQAGSDKTLRAMRRRYLTGQYASKIQMIKELMPHCCIGVDVIAGFPGETEQVFESSYEFIADLDVSYLHAFPYSERDHTAALSLGNVVPRQERLARARRLRSLSVRKRKAFYESNLGTVRPVLVENGDDGSRGGFTDNYIRVSIAGTPAANQVVPVMLAQMEPSLSAVAGWMTEGFATAPGN